MKTTIIVKNKMIVEYKNIYVIYQVYCNNCGKYNNDTILRVADYMHKGNEVIALYDSEEEAFSAWNQIADNKLDVGYERILKKIYVSKNPLTDEFDTLSKTTPLSAVLILDRFYGGDILRFENNIGE